MAPIKKSIRGLMLALTLFLGLVAFTSITCLALPIPNLQLDIAGGTYDATSQTIIAPGSQFALYAYLYLDPLMPHLTLNTTYYISAALAPMASTRDVGSFIFNSDYFNREYNGTAPIGQDNIVNFATDGYVDSGTPPHFDSDYNRDTKYLPRDSGDLSQHGVFPTVFKEFKVEFKEESQMSRYDTRERALAAGAIPSGISGSDLMYYATFEVDTSSLSPGKAIHFDLYTLFEGTGSADLDVEYCALFNHDAQSLTVSAASVPDASIMFLLGPGLVGLGVLGRRKFVK
jgi:hypothetical protein